ncbi:hypothetical protein OWM54_27275 [Myxococcus sp. MISCRS1]|uniref:hypothetical protein n=1 Tax=Myxococcus sp. MISCRS1 TaxID=2996786 RepID=UPI0022701089|nr:hypothetical protein [Myxococcus sp. MISCRS1]MCY1000858.1 hypothetical protein [Myxococcus sp. MISCRS1]
MGHVGFFSTAGGGYAPDEFLRDIPLHDRALELIAGMKPCTTAIPQPDQSSEPEDVWRRMAERGIFAFDASPLGGPYQLIARPETAIRIEALPPETVRAAKQITLAQLRFSDVSVLDEPQLVRSIRVT